MQGSTSKKHLSELVTRITGDFDRRVKVETTLSNVLLKGHLLIENILSECLASLNKPAQPRAGFHKKTELLKEASERLKKEISKTPADERDSWDTISQTSERIWPALIALNETRNRLAHSIDFDVSDNDVSYIGTNLGIDFIEQKYTSGHSATRENLLFCLDKIVHGLGLVIYARLETLPSIKAKRASEAGGQIEAQTPSAVATSQK